MKTTLAMAGLLGLMLLTTLQPVAAQTPPPARTELFRTVEALDKTVFDAFNHCDLDKLESMFAEDVEFYHDKDGLSVSRKAFIEAVKKNVCGKFTRQLKPDTLQVYPMDKFGALQMGSHLFCQAASGRCEGMGRFMHVWRNTQGRWEITRVFSYDHQPAPR